MECGGLPPLFAVPACRDALQLCAIALDMGEARLTHRAGASSGARQRRQAAALHRRLGAREIDGAV